MISPFATRWFATILIVIASSALAQDAPTLNDLESRAASGTASIDERLDLARRYLAAGRFYEAMKLGEAVLAIGPDERATAIVASAREGLESHQREKLALAEERAAAPGATAEDRLALADASFGAGRYLTAAEIYRQLPDRLQTKETRLRRARALSWAGRMWDAEPIYAELLRTDPSLELEIEYGKLLSWMGTTAAAQERLAAVYERTRSEDAIIALANALAWSGNREEAIRLLRSHVEVSGESAKVQEMLGTLTESPHLTIERVDRLIEVEPFNLALRMQRARLLVDAGSYQQALKAIEDLEENLPRGRSAPEGLAELRARANEGRAREKEALERRRAELASREASSPEETLELAKAYTGVGGHDEAIELYERYLQARPDDDKARIAYARVLTWDSRYERAKVQYRRLLEEYPDRADLRLEYAKALSWHSDYRRAINELEALTDLSDSPRAHLYPEIPPQAHFHLGQIYRWFGWRDHAFEHQSAALDLEPTYSPARRELDMIRGLRPAASAELLYTGIENASDFEASMIDLRLRHWTSSRTAIEGWLGRHHFESGANSVDADVVGVGGRYRFDDRLTGYGRVGITSWEGEAGTRPFWTLGGEHLPNLQTRVAAEYARYDLIYDAFTLESIEGLPADPLDPISIDDLRLHWDYDGGGRFLYLVDASYGLATDDNERSALHGLLTFRVHDEPFIALKADYRHLSYDFRSPRYWSPSDYNSLAGVVQIGDNYRERISWQAELKVGQSWDGGRSHDIRSVGARVTVGLTDALDLVARYVEGESGDLGFILPNDDSITYWQRRFYVGVRVKRLFSGDDRDRRDRWYWNERPLEGSSVIPPIEERR